ncbi:MAG: hypothetical protein WBB38_15700 [Hyphomicrobiaceae bacterium]
MTAACSERRAALISPRGRNYPAFAAAAAAAARAFPASFLRRFLTPLVFPWMRVTFALGTTRFAVLLRIKAFRNDLSDMQLPPQWLVGFI